MAATLAPAPPAVNPLSLRLFRGGIAHPAHEQDHPRADVAQEEQERMIRAALHFSNVAVESRASTASRPSGASGSTRVIANWPSSYGISRSFTPSVAANLKGSTWFMVGTSFDAEGAGWKAAGRVASLLKGD